MRMKLYLLLAMSLIVLGGTAMAQDEAPKAEIFGGFSYMRTPANNNVAGWNGQAVFNAKKWFGIAADVAGHYQTADSVKGTSSASLTSFLFGPQVADRAGRVTGFAHALFGFAHSGDGFRLYGVNVTGSHTDFAMAFGGGVDANVSDKAAIRVFQVDFEKIRAENPINHQIQGRNAFRLSMGIVIKIK